MQAYSAQVSLTSVRLLTGAGFNAFLHASRHKTCADRYRINSECYLKPRPRLLQKLYFLWRGLAALDGVAVWVAFEVRLAFSQASLAQQ